MEPQRTRAWLGLFAGGQANAVRQCRRLDLRAGFTLRNPAASANVILMSLFLRGTYMTRSLLAALLVLCLALPTVRPADDDNPAKEALQALNEYIGSWKGAGSSTS